MDRRVPRLIGAVTCLAGLAAGASAPRVDRVWKKYQDAHLGYCLSYPKRWSRGEGNDGNALYFEIGNKKNSLPLGEIDVAVLRNELSSASDYLQLHLAGLQKFERAERMQLLANGAIQVGGMQGVFSRHRYFDPLEKRSWVDELVIAGQGTTLYRLELECRAEQLPRFQPVFERLVNSFRPDCNLNAHTRHPEN